MDSPTKWLPNGTKAAPAGNASSGPVVATVDNIAALLANDTKVKVAAVDCDGILRGKVMSKEKFLSSVEYGFAMSSAVFGWDMHDEIYTTETRITTAEEGYADFLAFPDLSTFRRLPFEDDLPFVLLNFGPRSNPVPACGRSMLRSLCQRLSDAGYRGQAGGMC